MSRFPLALPLFITLALSSCGATSGPDKTAAGTVLGAGWGAGTGAIVGNQIGHPGQGAGVGAGFGALAGAIEGGTFDTLESDILDQEQQLASLKVQNAANAQSIADLQRRLDQSINTDLAGGISQVFFDADSSTVKAGAVANLEIIAEAIKSSPRAGTIHVVGHADDAGTPEYNSRLAEARARAVSGYLGARGVSMSQIVVSSFGSTRPLASNATPVGRQLNRRVDIFVGRNAPTSPVS
ncbi:MAG: OmpA family protein [Oligoflexia bacterium]|nr:OmpA family protein [Oligoflexia bacterium]